MYFTELSSGRPELSSVKHFKISEYKPRDARPMLMPNKTAPTENIREAIMEVVAFFDVFSYPLSAPDVWQFLNLKSDSQAVLKNLEYLRQRGKINRADDLYFLPGRENLPALRRERHGYSRRKLKKARLMSRLFALVPWIKMIAVGNSIGRDNSRRESDIDLLIIAEKDRLWLSRFFCALAAMALGQRPGRLTVKNKICLSFFLSEENLDLRPLLLKNNNGSAQAGLKDFPDPYFLYWLACLQPVYDRDGTYERLIRENSWLAKKLPNWRPPAGGFSSGEKRSGLYRGLADLLIGRLDDPLRRLQIRLFPLAIKEKLNINTCVVADRGIIKLHTNDRREYFLDKYRERLRKSNINNSYDK